MAGLSKFGSEWGNEMGRKRKLATAIARRIFEIGETATMQPSEPHRIAYMHKTSDGKSEKKGCGLCESSLAKVIYDFLKEGA